MLFFEEICLGFDVRIIQHPINIIENNKSHKFQIGISGDPNVLPRSPETQNLISNGVFKISNPIWLFISEEALNNHFNEVLKNNIAMKICITSSQLTASALEKIFGYEFIANSPPIKEIKDNHWIFCGWDILDVRGLYSGIDGCGPDDYLNNNLLTLNDKRLFDSIENARIYAESKSIRIQQHSPFVVTGIYIKQS